MRGDALLVLTALAITVAAAVRSTWSPCGASMLSTLTPIGERGRGAKFGTTARWFLVGALAGGGALGALGALGTVLVAALPLDGRGTDIAGAAALAAGAGADLVLAGRRAVGHHRQVNERWLDQFRPWVYGAGFGFQIGCGLVTYVTTAGVYLVVVLGALSGRPLFALGLGLLFGLLRGSAVYLGRRLDSPEALRRFHARFIALAPRSRAAMVAIELLAAAAVIRSAVALIVVGVLLAATAARGRASGPMRWRPMRGRPSGEQRPSVAGAGSRGPTSGELGANDAAYR
jgi:hypothetical protein